MGLRIRAEDRHGNARIPMISNQAFGGPGRGDSGVTNSKALGNVLIISEDGRTTLSAAR